MQQLDLNYFISSGETEDVLCVILNVDSFLELGVIRGVILVW